MNYLRLESEFQPSRVGGWYKLREELQFPGGETICNFLVYSK